MFFLECPSVACSLANFLLFHHYGLHIRRFVA